MFHDDRNMSKLTDGVFEASREVKELDVVEELHDEEHACLDEEVGCEKFVVVMETFKGSFFFEKMPRQLSKKEHVLEWWTSAHCVYRLHLNDIQKLCRTPAALISCSISIYA